MTYGKPTGEPADLGADLCEVFQDGDHVYAVTATNPMATANTEDLQEGHHHALHLDTILQAQHSPIRPNISLPRIGDAGGGGGGGGGAGVGVNAHGGIGGSAVTTMAPSEG